LGGGSFEYRWNRRGLPWKQFVRDNPNGASAFQVVQYTYDNASQLTLVERSGLSGAIENDMELVYDKDGYLIERHEWNGQDSSLGAFVYRYDYGDAENGAMHQLASVSRNWGSNGSGGFNKTEVVWQAGDGSGSVSDAYDEMGRLLAWRDSIGLKNYQTFDSFGRLRRKYREAESGKYTASEYKYNSRGYVREIEVGGIAGTPASPSSVWWDQHRIYRLNNEGDLLYTEVYEEVNGATSVYPSRRHEYRLDGWGRVLSNELWHGKKDATASLAQVAVVEYDYDALNRVIQKRVIDDASQSTYVEVVDVHYDDSIAEVRTIRTVSGTNGFSEEWKTKYDDLGRPYEDIQKEWDAGSGAFNSNTRTWKTDWDYLDRAWGSEDPEGVRHEVGFDGRGRLDWEKRIAAGGTSDHETDYQYHATNGTLWKVVDAESKVTIFDTDSSNFNRPLKTTYPDGRWEKVDSRDSFGRVTQISDSRTPLTRTFTYSFGRLVSDVADWGSNANIVGPSKFTWEYDVEEREVTSKVFTGTSGAYTQVWETYRDFNPLGELETETQGAGSDAMSWGFVSGYAGEIRRVNYPAGLGITKGLFDYADDGRPIGAEYSDSAVMADYQFAYNGRRLATRTDTESDLRLETGYDGWGHLTKVEWAHDTGSGWAVLDGQERAFDPASRVIARKRSIDTNGEVFEHDDFGRLETWYQGVPSALSHTPGSVPSSWTKLEDYDLNEVYARTEVTKQTSGQSATTESYTSTSGAHFYNTVPDGQGGTKGRTEYEGYLSDDSDFLYRYDAWGRLTEVERKSDNTVIREHLHDVSGRRVRTIDNTGKSTRHLYWGSRLAAQFDEGTSPANIRTYGYAGGGDSEAFVVVTGAGAANGSYDLARDFQGSILALTDRSTGSVVERYRYSAFGEVSIEDATGTSLSASAFANDRFFMGRPLDAETGLYDVRARWYDSATGSFISPDPWGSVDSWNMYQYGFATPGTWLDPSGLSSGDPIWVAILKNWYKLTPAGAAMLVGGVAATALGTAAGTIPGFADGFAEGVEGILGEAGELVAEASPIIGEIMIPGSQLFPGESGSGGTTAHTPGPTPTAPTPSAEVPPVPAQSPDLIFIWICGVLVPVLDSQLFPDAFDARDGNGKNDQHGSDSKSESTRNRIEDLEKELANLNKDQGPKKDKKKLRDTINQLKKDLKRSEKGENHSRRPK
jgi:RHS repeat-associated protein